VKCKICGSQQSKQKGGVYDDSKKNILILVCPTCGRKCPDCGGIQNWEDIGEMIKGQGSVGFTWMCSDCGLTEYNKEMADTKEFLDYEPKPWVAFLGSSTITIIYGLSVSMVYLFRLFGLVALIVPFLLGYLLFYGDWKNENSWDVLAGMAFFFSIMFALVGLAITKTWVSKDLI